MTLPAPDHSGLDGARHGRPHPSPSTPPQPPATEEPPRSGFADALRGFALIGICVVNLPWLASSPPAPPGGLSPLDTAAQLLITALFEGKFFVLFSLLFGFGFGRQLARVRAGRSTPSSYARRLLGLFVLGVLHAALLFVGDILVTYALLGALLWTVRDWPDFPPARRSRASRWRSRRPPSPCSPGATRESTTRCRPRSTRKRRGAPMRAGSERPSRGASRTCRPPPRWCCCSTGRSPSAPSARAWWRDGAACSTIPRALGNALPPVKLLAAGAVVGNLGAAASYRLPDIWAPAAYALLAVGAPCLSALYALALARAWRSRRMRAWLEACLVPAGRMSLSNYLGQSLAANLVVAGWGFGLYASVAPAALLPSALAIAATGLAALRALAAAVPHRSGGVAAAGLDGAGLRRAAPPPVNAAAPCRQVRRTARGSGQGRGGGGCCGSERRNSGGLIVTSHGRSMAIE